MEKSLTIPENEGKKPCLSKGPTLRGSYKIVV